MGEAWERPARLGVGAASDAVGQVAAPLLAGFSVTLVGLLVQADEGTVRWREASLIFVTAASILFVASLQCGFHGRQFFYTPADVDAWWPREATEPVDEDLVAGQRLDHDEWRRWYKRTSTFYDLGIFALAGGVALMLSPPAELESDAAVAARWAAVLLASLAAAAELTWWVKADLAIWGKE